MADRPYIVGNWKMNGSRALLAEARAIDRGAARYKQAGEARQRVRGARGGVRPAL